jgi:hypothetical protein
MVVEMTMVVLSTRVTIPILRGGRTMRAAPWIRDKLDDMMMVEIENLS